MIDVPLRKFTGPDVDAWFKRKRGKSAPKRAVWSFGSFTEYVDAAAGDAVDGRRDNRLSHVADDWFADFCLTRDFSEAKSLALQGWHEGTKEIHTLTSSMAAGMNVQRYGMDLALVGGSVDIPTFLTGEPECMWTWKDTVQRKGARLIVEGSVAGGVKTADIIRRGAAVASLVDALESGGVSTEIELRFTLRNNESDRYVQHRIALKQSSEPLDLATLAFALAHPSSFRRFTFGVCERLPDDVKKDFGFTRFGHYGLVDNRRSPTEIFGEEDVLIEGNNWGGNMTDSMQWIKRTAQQFGVDVE